MKKVSWQINAKYFYLLVYSIALRTQSFPSDLYRRSGLHIWLVMWRLWVWAPSKAPVVTLSKKHYPYCLVLVGSRNGFERDFTIALKGIEGLMEDWLKCQISLLVKYRQNQTVQWLFFISWIGTVLSNFAYNHVDFVFHLEFGWTFLAA